MKIQGPDSHNHQSPINYAPTEPPPTPLQFSKHVNHQTPAKFPFMHALIFSDHIRNG